MITSSKRLPTSTAGDFLVCHNFANDVWFAVNRVGSCQMRVRILLGKPYLAQLGLTPGKGPATGLGGDAPLAAGSQVAVELRTRLATARVNFRQPSFGNLWFVFVLFADLSYFCTSSRDQSPHPDESRLAP